MLAASDSMGRPAEQQDNTFRADEVAQASIRPASRVTPENMDDISKESAGWLDHVAETAKLKKEAEDAAEENEQQLEQAKQMKLTTSEVMKRKKTGEMKLAKMHKAADEEEAAAAHAAAALTSLRRRFPTRVLGPAMALCKDVGAQLCKTELADAINVCVCVVSASTPMPLICVCTCVCMCACGFEAAPILLRSFLSY